MLLYHLHFQPTIVTISVFPIICQFLCNHQYQVFCIFIHLESRVFIFPESSNGRTEILIALSTSLPELEQNLSTQKHVDYGITISGDILSFGCITPKFCVAVMVKTIIVTKMNFRLCSMEKE